MSTYKWNEDGADEGTIVVNMQEAHDLLVDRVFVNQDDDGKYCDIHEVIVVDEEVPEAITATVQSMINMMIQVVDDTDCMFHDLTEGEYC